MTYSELINLLQGYAEKDFALFQRRLILTKYAILGVRTPILRRLAKCFQGSEENLLTFPNDYYEVVFIKLVAISRLPYELFVQILPLSISLMDNWALCDCFKSTCILKRKDEFLGVLEDIFAYGGTYFQRYTLVILLNAYIEEQYRNNIKSFIRRSNTEEYYVHMAVAWLIAEILIKDTAFGIQLLLERITDAKTHNKAIQKARESYRLNKEIKEYLCSLKIK